MEQNKWNNLLHKEFKKKYFVDLHIFIEEERRKFEIYPPKDDMFRALNRTDYDKVSVVILGQDPYHKSGQANGLSFSVHKGVRIPPSLRNIYKELHSDIGMIIPDHGDLVSWAEQGVLLLNTSLTVREGEASSHSNKGWEIFTDKVISLLNERDEPVIFILWGNHARSKKKIITNNHHHIIESVHPSPLSASRGFFGSKPFSQVNGILRGIGREEIHWQI